MKRFFVVVAIALAAVACRQPQKITAPKSAPVQAPIPQTLDEAAAALREGNTAAYEEGLEHLATTADPETRRRATALLAFFYQDQHRDREALAALARAKVAYPEIVPFLALREAASLRATGRGADALQLARNVAATRAASFAGERATILLPAYSAEAGDPAGATQSLAATGSIPIDEVNERDFVELGDRLERRKMTDAATSVRLRILDTYPQARAAETIYAALAALPPAQSPFEKLDFDRLIALADHLGRQNRYDQALDLLRRIEDRFPEKSSTPQFVFQKTTTLFNSRHYDSVIALPELPSGSPYAAALQLLRARAYWRNDRSLEFLTLTNGVIRDFPQSKEATSAKLLLSKYYVTDEPDFARSAELLREAIDAGAEGDQGENIWTLGWTEMLGDDMDAALQTFASYLQKYPDADYTSNVLFWSAKIREKRGETALRDNALKRLIDFYPYGYYSYRAREIAGLSSYPPSTIESGFSFPPESPEPPELAPRLAAAKALMSVGLLTDALGELKRAVGADPKVPSLAYRLADFYSSNGEHLKAIILLQRAFRDLIRHGGTNIPQHFWEILYPRDYWDAIVPAAAKQNVDPYLVTAIIRQESGFDTSIVSSAGAVGLMQLMPEEAPSIAARGGVAATVAREKLFDPATNIAIGAAEIRQKLDEMHGEPSLAIAAYNAGELAVGRWIAKEAIVDMDRFIDSIPFNETRLYVKSVTRNRHEYHRIYDPAGGIRLPN